MELKYLVKQGKEKCFLGHGTQQRRYRGVYLSLKATEASLQLAGGINASPRCVIIPQMGVKKTLRTNIAQYFTRPYFTQAIFCARLQSVGKVRIFGIWVFFFGIGNKNEYFDTVQSKVFKFVTFGANSCNFDKYCR